MKKLINIPSLIAIFLVGLFSVSLVGMSPSSASQTPKLSNADSPAPLHCRKRTYRDGNKVVVIQSNCLVYVYKIDPNK